MTLKETFVRELGGWDLLYDYEDGASDFSLASVPISYVEGDWKMFIEYPFEANQCTRPS